MAKQYLQLLLRHFLDDVFLTSVILQDCFSVLKCFFISFMYNEVLQVNQQWCVV